MNGIAPCRAKNARIAEHARSSRLTSDIAAGRSALMSGVDQCRTCRGDDGIRGHNHILAKTEWDIDHVIGLKQLIGRFTLLDLFQRQVALAKLPVGVMKQSGVSF